MNESHRQRLIALCCGSVALVFLGTTSGCQAGSTIEAAQTAVVAAQTTLPGAQATVQAAATLVGALADAQSILVRLQPLLAGAAVNVTTSPDGVANDAITDVTVEATDTQGSLAQLDTRTRQAAASAALLAAAQYYPNATITLHVFDSSGTAVISGTKLPNQLPRLQ
jgi:hypothetical protein